MPRQGFATSYLQQQKNVLTAQAEIENYSFWGDMAYSILVKIKLPTYESTTSFFFFDELYYAICILLLWTSLFT